MRRALVLVGLLLLAGCIERSSPITVEPYYVIQDAQPSRTTEFALKLVSTSTFKQDLPVAFDAPVGWNVTAETATVAIRGRDGGSLLVRVTPASDAAYAPQAIGVRVGDTRAEVMVNVRDLGREPIRAGIGAQVFYVLFATNGTLLSTNDPALRERPGIGNATLDDPNATESDVPLKVYVGGRRGEDPPEPYNSTGYRPVIAGFDARLRDAGDGRGMVAGDTLAVRVPKEQAYTLPGNEEHPLYGMDLSFLVRVVTVDELTPRPCDLPLCPDVPP